MHGACTWMELGAAAGRISCRLSTRSTHATAAGAPLRQRHCNLERAIRVGAAFRALHVRLQVDEGVALQLHVHARRRVPLQHLQLSGHAVLQRHGAEVLLARLSGLLKGGRSNSFVCTCLNV